jgi:hypothetical protein
MIMARAWMLVPLVLVMLASGCFGGATTHAPTPRRAPQPYAVFHIRGAYTSGSSTNHFGGELHRTRFTISCRSRRAYQALFGRVSWQEKLCLAILDYRTQIPTGIVCAGCPVSVVRVDVRGTIGGRPVHERFTPCLCGDGPRAAADARVILGTHPPGVKVGLP